MRSLLISIWKADRRNRKSLASFSSNNLFYLGMALLLFSDRSGALFFFVIIGVLLFLPAAADPLRSVPSERLALWPIPSRQHGLMRVITPWFNPLSWLLVALLIWRGVTVGLWAILAGGFALGFVGPSRLLSGKRFRAFPAPALGGSLSLLVRKNVRQLFSTLDVYAGGIMALLATGFRAAGRMPDEAMLPATLLSLLLMSTGAQSLFGLDGGGLVRYRLMPLRGWQILVAKGTGFGVIGVLITLGLAPVAGFCAVCMMLAVGHFASVVHPRPERAWTLQTSPSLGSSLVQIAAMIAAGIGASRLPWVAVPVCVLAYALSTWIFGRRIDRGGI